MLNIKLLHKKLNEWIRSDTKATDGGNKAKRLFNMQQLEIWYKALLAESIANIVSPRIDHKLLQTKVTVLYKIGKYVKTIHISKMILKLTD